MRFRRAATTTAVASVFAITLLYISLPRLVKDMLWLLSSRVSRKLFGGLAPLSCNLPPGHPIDTYVVSLAHGYSLDQHKQTIGRSDELEQVIVDAGEMDGDPVFGKVTIYEAKFEDPTLVAAIRSDLGVLLMECHGQPHLRGWPVPS